MAKSPNEDVFNRIKEELEHGTVPWHKPWVVREDCVLSHTSGKPYSLRNRMLLSFAGEYATFYQVKKAGGTVNKGAKGKYVYFAKEVKRKSENEDDKPEYYYLLRGYHVFNILDTSLTPKYADRWGGDKAPECNALGVLRDYCSRTGVSYIEAGSEAFYSRNDDRLQIPNINTFESESEFWSTVFHEAGHSTAKRLDRKLGVCMLGMADDNYCKEELVAEICAALCLGHLGIDTEDSMINSAAYIKSWQGHLTEMTPNDFTTACYEAQRAYKLIFNITETTNKE
jgi:antirestriction protein ArdC